MLRELLVQHRRLVVHCFVRARNAEGGLQRLRDRMKQADIWDEKFEPRIWVVVGESGKACLGLSEKDFEFLCQQTDAIYHLAADLTLVSSYAAIRDVNTVSLRSLLELCLRNRRKHLFYASTLAVFSQYFAHLRRNFRIDALSIRCSQTWQA